jgi:translation initiation factor 1 (eIF-1/SUI1)
MGDFDTNDFDTNDFDESEINSNKNEEITEDSKDILKEIDKNIKIKYMKEVKTSRTYIFGLNNYIESTEKINEFIKSIKKLLGTSMIEKKDNLDNNVYGFAGDHVKFISEYLIKKNICTQNDIKK